MNAEQSKVPATATASLILGILGLVLIGPLGSIPAVICGHVARKKIRSEPAALRGAGMALAGLILGYVQIALTVVAVIAISIMFPMVLRKTSGKAQSIRAEVEIQQLSVALQAFRVEYAVFPAPSGGGEGEQDNRRIVAILTAKSGDADAAKYNPRKIMFFETPDSSGTMNDPWGHAYHIILDTDSDNRVRIGSTDISTSAAIWSDGPNGTNESGQGDDIASWQ